MYVVSPLTAASGSFARLPTAVSLKLFMHDLLLFDCAATMPVSLAWVRVCESHSGAGTELSHRYAEKDARASKARRGRAIASCTAPRAREAHAARSAEPRCSIAGKLCIITR